MTAAIRPGSGARVAALFVRSDSIYKTLAAVECYDYDRDARTYAGPVPVVAHPPCGAWGRFRRHVEKRSGRKHAEERELGRFAVECVRRWGGVLEQPACSDLWADAALPVHGVDAAGGYTLQVCQSWWGHEAEKCTWLYVVNGLAPLPGSPLDLTVPRRGLLQLGRRAREATPEAFARWLVAIAADAHSSQVPLDLATAIPPAGQLSSRPFELGGHSRAGPFDLGRGSPIDGVRS